MKTANQFAQEINAIRGGFADDTSIVVVEPSFLDEEIADWRGPLQDVQVRLRQMMHKDIDKFMESAQQILSKAEQSGWSKLVIENEVARWSGDINRVYASFKNSTKGFQDLAKAMGITSRRHSGKNKPLKRGKMDWGKLTQVQLKKEVRSQLKRLSSGIHSLADDGAFMLRQIDRILKYKQPKDETVREEIGALFQDFVDFRNAFGSKVWGPYKGLLGRLGSIRVQPLGQRSKEYRSAMRKRPLKSMPPTPQSQAAHSALPIDCPELREAIERDRLRATRGVLGEDQEEAAALIEGIEAELLGEAWSVYWEFDKTYPPRPHKEPMGSRAEAIKRAKEASKQFGTFVFVRKDGKDQMTFYRGKAEGIEYELLGEVEDPEEMRKAVQKVIRGSKYDQRKMMLVLPDGRSVMFSRIGRAQGKAFIDVWKDGKKLLKGVEVRSPSDVVKRLKEGIEYELLGEVTEAKAGDMKAKGYGFKVLLKDKPPLYAKTESGAKKLAKDYPGSKVVVNESEEIDDPMVIEAAETGDLLDHFEDFDGLLYGEDDELEEAVTPTVEAARYAGEIGTALAKLIGGKVPPRRLGIVLASGIEVSIIGKASGRPGEQSPAGTVEWHPAGTYKPGHGFTMHGRPLMHWSSQGTTPQKIAREIAAKLRQYVKEDEERPFDEAMASGKTAYDVPSPGGLDKKLSPPDPPRSKPGGMSQVVKTILQQFGGGRAMMMIGGQVHIVDSNTLGVKWPNKKRSKGNYVEIKYIPGRDLYDMEFFNVSIRGKKSVKKFKGIYNDMLVSTFEKQTGWYLHL